MAKINTLNLESNIVPDSDLQALERAQRASLFVPKCHPALAREVRADYAAIQRLNEREEGEKAKGCPEEKRQKAVKRLLAPVAVPELAPCAVFQKEKPKDETPEEKQARLQREIAELTAQMRQQKSGLHGSL